MGKLISVSVWQKNSNPAYASASTNVIQEDFIKYATNATTSLKQSVPSASANINSVLYINFNEANEGTDSVWLVQDSLATIVSGSN
jgi:hypothetical protein